MSSIYIYWDESHFWGLMAVRALTAWGIDHRLVRGSEIAQGILADKPPKVLLVPGGRAKGKTERLGPKGMDAIRTYVASGGTYLGFCGGAGLALSGGGGLGLCPWKRRGFTNRLQHFLSGHIHVTLNMGQDLIPPSLGEAALLPVWWPGQFGPEDDEVTVLACFGRPGPDFWVADLALDSLPKGTMTDWEAMYGIGLNPDFLEGNPCVVTGSHGQGRYILSYAHLETPASSQANGWLAHLLGRLLDTETTRPPLPAWNLTERPVVWHDPVLTDAREMLTSAINTGLAHLLLFWRTPWLLGWRRGIPGAGINALFALVCESLASQPTPAASAFWAERSEAFAKNMELLYNGLTGFLLAERLAMTVFHSETDSVPGLKERREILFGPPPGAGGVYGELLDDLETLFYLL
ncbi:MAG: biotin--protein ligase [Proteobacteria bacterium]|nr:biotin--protein ligase [Pseudomonadota bacterium]